MYGRDFGTYQSNHLNTLIINILAIKHQIRAKGTSVQSASTLYLTHQSTSNYSAKGKAIKIRLV